MNIPTDYIQTEPFDSVYWVACKGKCVSVKPKNINASCIARVQDDFSRENGLKFYDGVYVVFNPKYFSEKPWKIWSKKWSLRTKQS